ncbi:uncharacterized protein LOC108103540 [Drosophila eugracilis]|uniref:uncharacterized protein LOC108103540 n=1 Tax=Drosophila eugracilis TaxID=29029 RepID=UPI0007E6B621|nr:uncharacterized protein LOC108103540 [Drosophila eugracilis]
MPYKIRTLPQQRSLVPNLLRSILHVLEETRRPMTDTELYFVLGNQYKRNDTDFYRQVKLYLNDAVEYGILKRQRNLFSLRSRRLGELLGALGPTTTHR